jgi:ABC-type maltose transport system permease subunit
MCERHLRDRGVEADHLLLRRLIDSQCRYYDRYLLHSDKPCLHGVLMMSMMMMMMMMITITMMINLLGWMIEIESIIVLIFIATPEIDIIPETVLLEPVE